MKKNRLFLLIIFMLLAGLILVACGGGAEEDAEPEAPAAQTSETEAEVVEPEEAAEPEAPEVEEAPPVEEAEAEEPIEEESQAESAPETEPAEEASEEEASSPIAELLQISEVDTDEGLENYEMTLSITFTAQDDAGNDVTQTILAEIVNGTNPDVMSMNMSMEGVEGAEEFGSVSMVQVDGTSYMVVPGMGCITTSAAENDDNPFADLADSDRALESVNKANFVGEETINGVETLHYTFDESDLDPEEAADIEWVEGHIYLAKEGDYMVRFIMEGEGVMDQFSTGEDQFGTMYMVYDITPIDGAVSVEVPTECAGSGADNAPYPVLDDASDYSSFGGLISYMTAVPFAEAITFYDEGLIAEGWTKDEAASMSIEGSLFNATYTRDGETINVMITVDADAGVNSVLIIEGE